MECPSTLLSVLILGMILGITSLAYAFMKSYKKDTIVQVSEKPRDYTYSNYLRLQNEKLSKENSTLQEDNKNMKDEIKLLKNLNDAPRTEHQKKQDEINKNFVARAEMFRRRDSDGDLQPPTFY